MKYNVGQKVRVRKDLEVGKTYDGSYFNHGMGNSKGKIVTIREKYEECYKLEEFDYCWTDEMLEPVEDIIEYKGKKYEVINKFTNFCGKEVFYTQEHKEEILDKEEKEYLRNVIKPFRDEVKFIKKAVDGNKYFIDIELSNAIYDGLCLPYFKDKRMYKRMELYEPYTLEQLGLDD